MDKKKTIAVTLRLTPEVFKKLEKAAEESHRSKAGLIRALLDDYFEQKGIK